jgi:hypothetical protein
MELKTKITFVWTFVGIFVRVIISLNLRIDERNFIKLVTKVSRWRLSQAESIQSRSYFCESPVTGTYTALPLARVHEKGIR